MRGDEHKIVKRKIFERAANLKPEKVIQLFVPFRQSFKGSPDDDGSTCEIMEQHCFRTHGKEIS